MSQKSKLPDIPVTDQTLKGMSWNIDDRKFYKVGLDYQTNLLKSHITRNVNKQFSRIARELAETLIARDRVMFDKMDEQTALIKTIQEDVDQVKKDIDGIKIKIKDVEDGLGKQLESLAVSVEKLKKKNSGWAIAKRITIAVLIAVLMALLAFTWYHTKYLQ